LNFIIIIIIIKLNPCQHGFTKSKTMNLVTYLDFITTLVGSQRQADAIYLDLTSASDVVPHTGFFTSLVL
jgi:hypothetical protein